MPTQTEDRVSIKGASLDWLPADTFTTDPSYDRPANESRINQMAERWSDEAIGVVYASKRKGNGKYYLLDGQHRVGALKKQGRKKDLVPTLVFEGLSVEQEARLFVIMNKNRRALLPSEIFRASLVEGDPAAKEIQAVLDGLDLKLESFAAGPRTVKAVAAVQRMYRGVGAEGLDAVLSLILMSWGDPPPNRSFHEHLMLALARVLFFAEGKIDIDRLRNVLTEDTPDQWISRADSIRSLAGGQLQSILATDVISKYNKGLTGGKRLDEEAFRKSRDPFAKAQKYQRRGNAASAT